MGYCAVRTRRPGPDRFPPPQPIQVEPVWSAHPVGFALLTHPPFQFVAYYNVQRQMTVAQRSLDSTNWTFTRLDSTLGWDSHNYVTLAMDRDNVLHLAGNMHCVPLVYFRAAKPLDAGSLRRVEAMTGPPGATSHLPGSFSTTGPGDWSFRYRDGRSGSGDDLYNCYGRSLTLPGAGYWTNRSPAAVVR